MPDSLLGSAWPVMRMDLDVPISYAGIISMIMCAGTIASSLSADRVIRKFGTGVVTAFSVVFLPQIHLLSYAFGRYHMAWVQVR